jgi:hypothetical protein
MRERGERRSKTDKESSLPWKHYSRCPKKFNLIPPVVP